MRERKDVPSSMRGKEDSKLAVRCDLRSHLHASDDQLPSCPAHAGQAFDRLSLLRSASGTEAAAATHTAASDCRFAAATLCEMPQLGLAY